MDFTKRLALSYYKMIAVLNEEHHIYLVDRIHQPVLRWICVLALDIVTLFFIALIMLQLEPVFFPD